MSLPDKIVRIGDTYILENEITFIEHRSVTKTGVFHSISSDNPVVFVMSSPNEKIDLDPAQGFVALGPSTEYQNTVYNLNNIFAIRKGDRDGNTQIICHFKNGDMKVFSLRNSEEADKIINAWQDLHTQSKFSERIQRKSAGSERG